MCDRKCDRCCPPYTYKEIENIVEFLKSHVNINPKVGVICGTGLGSITTLLSNPTILSYKDIPNFPTSTVPGHEGRLLFGFIKATPVICMQGRFHLFEGYPLWKCVLPVRIMKLLGISTLILSNAAGGINSSYKVGDIMLIKDHINFVSLGGQNPLQGLNDDHFGSRFVAMNDAYDRQLLNLSKKCAKELDMSGVHEGVYGCLGGPSFETVAEWRALKMLGVDAIGMSTVHEVITARHCGIKCLAFSLVTNICSLEYDSENKPNHIEILEVGKEREMEVKKLVEKIFQKIDNLL